MPDELYERVRKQFSEAEMVNLPLAVATINGWNRATYGERRLHFGLGPATSANLEIRWPYGGRASLPGIGADQLVVVRERATASFAPNAFIGNNG